MGTDTRPEMPSPDTPRSEDTRAHHADFLLEQTRLSLANAKGRVSDAIRTYPAPITACDQQFNHLLEERHRLGAALRRLDVIKETIISSQERLTALRALIRDVPELEET